MSQNIEIDYSKLRGRIVEVLGSQEALANAMRISYPTLSKKLNNKTYFCADEIICICKLLGITKPKIGEYFFSRVSK